MFVMTEMVCPHNPDFAVPVFRQNQNSGILDLPLITVNRVVVKDPTVN